MIYGREKGKDDFTRVILPKGIAIEQLIEEVENLALHMQMDVHAVRQQWLHWIEQTYPLGSGDIEIKVFDEPWRSLPGTGKIPALVDFALNLLSIPASEACCERSISHERDILGENRFRLTSEALMSQMRSRTYTVRKKEMHQVSRRKDDDQESKA
jgi:hypothetical protein